MLKDFMGSLEKNKDSIKSNITKAHLKENKIGICPNCGKNLIIKQSRRGERFVGCTNFPSCRTAYPLPQKGIIEETGKLCDACNTPIILIKSKGKKKSEICLNPKCPKILDTNNFGVVGRCPKCGNDLIIRNSRAGDIFVGCTNFPRCKNTYSLPKNGEIITTDRLCELCNTPIAKVKTDKEIKEFCLNPECSKIKKVVT
jgi:DNA topoisomerase-1